MGFSLQGLPLVAIGAPLGAHAFLSLPAAGCFPGGKQPQPGRLQGLLPATSPCCHRNPRVPAVDPFLGLIPPEHAPVRPGAHFDRSASPLALLRLDVQARLGLRVLRCEQVGWSVSGPPALLGFRTFRPTRCSVRRSSGLAHGFASRFLARLRARGRDPCPSVTAQQQIPGLLPGTGAIRSTIDDLVRSSVLVFQRAAHRCALVALRATRGPNLSTPRKKFSLHTLYGRTGVCAPSTPLPRALSTMCASGGWGSRTPSRSWKASGQAA